MSATLRLYNSFTKITKPVSLSGKLITTCNAQPVGASLYVCGPTVYSDCHVGHAINYIRVDLFRKFLRRIFNVELTTVMNITDIDDKILNKEALLRTNKQLSSHQHANEALKQSVKQLTEQYFNSFLADLNLIRVARADLFIKVSEQIDYITQYIAKLEQQGNAYVGANRDVFFSVDSIQGYASNFDKRKHTTSKSYKQNKQDFSLWKSHKPGEPSWEYYSPVRQEIINGRPGWHVQCSAIATAIFGQKLDFHFGGCDLLFPHHYNENACICCFNESKSINFDWCDNWLHSGHLVIKDEKMSKSLNNVIAIKDFISRSSINSLRLLCVDTHYRSNINYSQAMLEKLSKLDHKLNFICDYLHDCLRVFQSDNNKFELTSDGIKNTDLRGELLKAKDELLLGICDDFDLSRGLTAILELSKKVYSMNLNETNICDIVDTWKFIRDWCKLCEIEYPAINDGVSQKDLENMNSLDILLQFRNDIRENAIKELKETNKQSKLAMQLLKHCDDVRGKLDELGKIIRDTKTD